MVCFYSLCGVCASYVRAACHCLCLLEVFALLPIDTDTQLTWNRKIPVASNSVSGIKGKGAGATPAACGVTGTPRATALAGNTNGPGLGAINQELPSCKSPQEDAT